MLKTARKARLQRDRDKRWALKAKMQPYDRLSNKSKSSPSDFKNPRINTVHDLLQSLHNTPIVSRRRRGLTQQILDEVQVDSQIRAAWHAKFNMASAPLTQKTKQELVNMTKNQVTKPVYDELKLIAMIEAILRTWCPVSFTSDGFMYCQL